MPSASEMNHVGMDTTEPTKQPYEPPTAKVLGSIDDLTLAGGPLGYPDFNVDGVVDPEGEVGLSGHDL